MSKIQFDFGALDDLQDMLTKMDGNIDDAMDDALIASQKLIANKAGKAMEKHKRTGSTAESIIVDGEVRLAGGCKEIDVGFNLGNGGMPSVYLMYGTKLYGQPHIAPDKELYDAVFGKKTKKEVEEVQEKAFQKAIEEAMK